MPAGTPQTNSVLEYWLLRIFRLIHIYSAVVLVGSIIFNAAVLVPALRRIPPAHSAVISEKIGAGLMWLGGAAMILLGISGIARLWLKGQLTRFFEGFFSPELMGNWYWLGLMFVTWLVLVATAITSTIWYRTILTRKLPYSADLRELAARRISQAWVSAWQDRFFYINLVLALLATLGGVMASF